MSEEEKKKIIEETYNFIEFLAVKHISSRCVKSLLKIIRNQEQEKELMIGKIAQLNYETIEEWCDGHQCKKWENCDGNNLECMSNYFTKKVEKNEF